MGRNQVYKFTQLPKSQNSSIFNSFSGAHNYLDLGKTCYECMSLFIILCGRN